MDFDEEQEHQLRLAVADAVAAQQQQLAHQAQQPATAAAAQHQQQQQQIDLWGLSEEELEWSWALKIAVEADDDLKPLSDFEYVHQALYAKEDTEAAVARVRGLQYFREEYRISDEPHEGIRLIEAFMNKHPGFLLSVDIDETFGHFVMVYDYAKRRPGELKQPDDWRDHLGGMYYLSHCMQNNIHAVRQGIVHICECEGMGWDNFSYEVVRRNFSDLYENYPLKHKEISWLRTPTVGNILYAFMKPLLDPEAVRKFHLGCSFHGYDGRLDVLFNLPTPEIAKENLLMKLLGFLMVRYQMEQQYKLPDLLQLQMPMEDDDHSLAEVLAGEEAMMNATVE